MRCFVARKEHCQNATRCMTKRREAVSEAYEHVIGLTEVRLPRTRVFVAAPRIPGSAKRKVFRFNVPDTHGAEIDSAIPRQILCRKGLLVMNDLNVVSLGYALGKQRDADCRTAKPATARLVVYRDLQGVLLVGEGAGRQCAALRNAVGVRPSCAKQPLRKIPVRPWRRIFAGQISACTACLRNHRDNTNDSHIAVSYSHHRGCSV